MTGTRKMMTMSHAANDMAYAAAAALPLTTHHPASATPTASPQWVTCHPTS
ncbi:hypothetical protein PISMIDRAFT_682440, partial [Pisolithus microcarpus 441]